MVSKVAPRIKKKKTYTIDKIFGGKDNKHRKELLIPVWGRGSVFLGKDQGQKHF